MGLTALSLLLFINFLAQFVVGQQLTPWDNQIFSFGWDPYEPTINKCATIQNGWGDRTTASPPSQGPYNMLILSPGNVPFNVVSTNALKYTWNVHLPVGGPYLLTMTDQQGYTGGSSLIFQINDSGGTCATDTLVANTLQASVTGDPAQCGIMKVTVSGGTPPYKFQTFAAERPPKTTTWTTDTMAYIVDMKPLEQFFLVVTDAAGLISVNGLYTVAGGNSACLNQATTVVQGVVAETFSYDPANTNPPYTIPPTSTTSAIRITNTQTNTLTSTVTLGNGAVRTYTVDPGAELTIANTNPTSTSNSSNSIVLPVALGAGLGGALLIAIVAACIFYRRYKRKVKIDDRRQSHFSVGYPALPTNATQISPYTPPAGRESAPLMSNMYLSDTGSHPPSTVYTPWAPGVAHHPYSVHSTLSSPPPTSISSPGMRPASLANADSYGAGSSVGAVATASAPFPEKSPQFMSEQPHIASAAPPPYSD